MKPFWRSFWASTLSYIVLSILFFVVMFILFGALSSALVSKNNTTINKNTVLEINFKQAISERSELKFNNTISSPFETTLGLKEIKSSLLRAKKDDKIEGILLNTENIMIGLANLDELRNALIDFKKSVVLSMVSSILSLAIEIDDKKRKMKRMLNIFLNIMI